MADNVTSPSSPADVRQGEASLTEPKWDVSDQEKEHAKSLVKQVNVVLDSEEWKDYVKSIKKNRIYAKGRQHDDGEKGLVRANLIHAEVKSLITDVYAKDPDISCTPTEAVGTKEYEKYRAFGKTLELILRNQFGPAQANLKKRAKAAVRASATAFIGWVKLVYQKDYETDPHIETRIRDVQDNLERINHLIAKLDDESTGEGADLKAEQQELEQMIKALESEPEIVRAEGLVIDRPLSEDVVFSLDVMDSDNIPDARWITQRIWMTVDRCTQRFGFCPTKGSRYSENKTKREDKTNKELELVCILEMWNNDNTRVYTLMDGYEGYMREPFTPSKVGERFHGFFPLIFDPVDGEPLPNCLVQQLLELQDEHNTTRTNFAYHRKHSIPTWIGLAGKITPKDAAKITNAETMSVILIEGDETMPIENYIHQFQNPEIDPKVYTTEHIREDWEFITRKGDASRGMVAKAKTATEAQMLQGNMMQGNSEAQDVVEEWMRDITQYTAELVLQEMTYPQVQRIAGQEAVWPEMTKDSMFDMVSIELRAGSSGKPDKAREQEQWLKFLPELRETLLAIEGLESEGKEERADILKKLVEETLLRFDEKIDIEEWLPRVDEEAEADKKQKQQEQAQEMEQQQRDGIQLEMDKMVAEIRLLTAQGVDKLAEAEAREIGQQIEQYMNQWTELEKLAGMQSQQQSDDLAMVQGLQQMMAGPQTQTQ